MTNYELSVYSAADIYGSRSWTQLVTLASSMLRTSANKLVPNNFLKSFVFQRSDLLSDFKS